MRLIDADALIAKFESAKEGSNLRDTLYLDGVQAVIDNAPTITSQPDWTPCSEGLPDEEKMYEVTRRSEFGKLNVEKALFSSGTWLMDSDTGSVVAYRTLPEPYNPDHIRDVTKKVDQDSVSKWPDWKKRAATCNYELGKED